MLDLAFQVLLFSSDLSPECLEGQVEMCQLPLAQANAQA